MDEIALLQYIKQDICLKNAMNSTNLETSTFCDQFTPKCQLYNEKSEIDNITCKKHSEILHLFFTCQDQTLGQCHFKLEKNQDNSKTWKIVQNDKFTTTRTTNNFPLSNITFIESVNCLKQISHCSDWASMYYGNFTTKETIDNNSFVSKYQFWLIMLLFNVGLGFGMMPTVTLMDALTMNVLQGDASRFGKQRMWMAPLGEIFCVKVERWRITALSIFNVNCELIFLRTF